MHYYLTTYPMIFSASLAWVVAQALKVIIYLVAEGRVNIEKLIDSGGMPSSHTAFVVSLGTSIGFLNGFASTEFAIAFVLCGVVIYDATGIRRSAGQQAAALNEMIPQLLAGKLVKEHKDFGVKFKELLGHNPFEVFVGAIVGFAVTIAYLYAYDLITFPLNPSAYPAGGAM